MAKKIWRPLNSYGIYLLGAITGSVLVYSLLTLSRSAA